MDTQTDVSDFSQTEKLIQEFNIQGVILFDHKPVLRIQVPESEFMRVLELRNTLVEKLKPTGFRFIAVDLDSNMES